MYVVRNVSLRSFAISYALFQVSWGVLLVAVPVIFMKELVAGAVADSVVGELWAAAGLAGGLGALYPLVELEKWDRRDLIVCRPMTKPPDQDTAGTQFVLGLARGSDWIQQP